MTLNQSAVKLNYMKFREQARGNSRLRNFFSRLFVERNPAPKTTGRPRETSWSFGAWINFTWLLGFILTFFLAIFYFFQVNAITDEIHLAKNYNKKLQNLSQENKLLELNFLRSDSLENLRSIVDGLGFNPVGKTDYIVVPENTVVIKPR